MSEEGNIEVRKGYINGCIGSTVRMHGDLKIYIQNGLGLKFEASVGAAMCEFFLNYNEELDVFFSIYINKDFAGSITIDGKGLPENRTFVVRFFVVGDKYQGKGLGNKLLNLALKHCREVGKKGDVVCLNTFSGLNAARHLYEKNGFKLVREVKPSKWGKHLVSQDFELKF